MPLEIKLHTVPHFKALKYGIDILRYLVGKGMVGLLSSFYSMKQQIGKVSIEAGVVYQKDLQYCCPQGGV